jgi:hypothetical protein
MQGRWIWSMVINSHLSHLHRHQINVKNCKASTCGKFSKVLTNRLRFQIHDKVLYIWRLWELS